MARESRVVDLAELPRYELNGAPIFTSVVTVFPPLLLPIAICAAIGAGLFNAMIALAVSWFPWYARIMRGSVLRVKNELYVSAARAMGVSHTNIMIRHVVPNALTPVVVQCSLDFGYVILAAASLWLSPRRR